MLALCLLACQQPPGDQDPDAEEGDSSGDGDPTGDSGDSGSTGDVTVPEDNVARLLGDCDGTFVEPEAYGNQLVEGDDLHRYTLADPEAVCNDGTRALLYVRPYQDETLAKHWEIHVQGGGSCETGEDCAIRWCGLDYYDASKMSSRWAPDDVGAVGIMSAGEGNLLSGANHAYFYYCSSDSWKGSGQVRYSPESEDDPWPAFTMFERGHSILAAGIAELQAGVTADGGEVMPPLSDAELVVFSGTSAGSTGARSHADWLREELAADGTEVIAIFDAANDPPLSVFPEEIQAAGAELYRTLWENSQEGRDYLPWVDQSCWDHHTGTDEDYRCWEASFVVRNHVTTPFFLRQDLRDTTALADAAGLALDEFETYTRAGLLDLVDAPATALEEMTVTPGAYGPNCAQHVALETNDWWRVATVEDEGGTEYSFQDAVLAWYGGETVQIVDEAVSGDGDGPRSHCAETDDER